MSTGLVICRKCFREVHQDGENRSWRHCEDKTPMCPGGSAIYPLSEKYIKGKWCGKDGKVVGR
jgi:hypothetical protein